jgi:hypothetical protein
MPEITPVTTNVAPSAPQKPHLGTTAAYTAWPGGIPTPQGSPIAHACRPSRVTRSATTPEITPVTTILALSAPQKPHLGTTAACTTRPKPNT